MTAVAISPVSHDYDIASGAPTRDVSGGLMNRVIVRILTPLGSYWADTSIGSKLFTLARSKDVPQVALLAKQYTEQALLPLINDGSASSIVVTTEQSGDQRLYLLVRVTSTDGAVYEWGTFVGVTS